MQKEYFIVGFVYSVKLTLTVRCIVLSLSSNVLGERLGLYEASLLPAMHTRLSIMNSRCEEQIANKETDHDVILNNKTLVMMFLSFST